MRLEDALFNWLQIEVVSKARPDDLSAQNTAKFFREILTEDHLVTELSYSKDDTMYMLRYQVQGNRKSQMYDIEQIEQLLAMIENEPKYNN